MPMSDPRPILVVVMTIHKLYEGGGVDYYCNQVASGDVVRKKGVGLPDYYLESGNPPGRWVGSGASLLGLDGVVDEEQMRLLYGECRHPSTKEQLGQTPAQYPDKHNDRFELLLKKEWKSFEKKYGRVPEPGIEADVIRFMIARSYLIDHPREIPDVAKAYRSIARLREEAMRKGVEVEIPVNLIVQAQDRGPEEGEVQKFLAWRKAQRRQAVSGYDLVFTPPKSVSVLWGLSSRDKSRVIEEAHTAAWNAALEFLEANACYTRIGLNGVRQVVADGFVCSAFDHVDSRTGDPNLHTHLVISNRVHTSAVRGGTDRPFGEQWRSIDARLLYRLGVSASELYNLKIEDELSARLGLEFEDRFTTRGGEPVREVTGVPQELCATFSSRRSDIIPEAEKLIEDWTRRNGIAPSIQTQIRLFAEATKKCRPEKEKDMTLGKRRRQWHAKATEYFRSPAKLKDVISRLTSLAPIDKGFLSDDCIDALAVTTVDTLDQKHTAFPLGRTYSEAVRTVRSVLSKTAEGRVKSRCDRRLITAPSIDQIDLEDATSRVVTRLLDAYIKTGRAKEVVDSPACLRNPDGSSQYQDASKFWHFSVRALEREAMLLDAAKETAGPVFPSTDVEVLDPKLTPSQLNVASRFAGSGKRLDFAIGPAGSGKTTAMRAFCRTVHLNGGRVIALAPSAIAAAVLGHEVGADGETVAKFLHVHGRYGAPKGHVPPELRLDRQTIILVDEAAMTSTRDIVSIVELATESGASVRLLGDPAQLGAIGGGGALRLLHKKVGGATLEDIHRFADPQERDATLRLRDGRMNAVDFYTAAGRVRGGIHNVLLDDIYRAWESDSATGTSVMVSLSNADVVALNRRAQKHLVEDGNVTLTKTRLHEGSLLGVGDRVVTRSNNRRVHREGGDWVRNGDVWTVKKVHPNGKVTVRHVQDGGIAILPASYVNRDLELAYAATIHRVQGMTVDTSHVLVTPRMTREQLYVAATRGRKDNRFYVVSDPSLSDSHVPLEMSDSPAQILRSVIAREGAEISATELLETEQVRTSSASFLLTIYNDVLTEFGSPIDHDRAREVIESALGQGAEIVVNDPSWTTVARHLHALEETGADIETLVKTRVSVTDLLESDDVAGYVKNVLGEVGPGRRAGDTEIDLYLEKLEEAISTRLTRPRGTENLPGGNHDLVKLRRAWHITEPDPYDVEPHDEYFDTELDVDTSPLETPRLSTKPTLSSL